MKRALIYLVAIACAVAGIWGYAYEFAYFTVLKLDVHETLSVQHFVASGLANVLPMLGLALLFALLTKFFSRNAARDDLKHFHEEMKKTQFAQQLSIARLAFGMSLAYLLLVIFDVRFYAETSLGSLFWLVTFISMQSFVGAIYLSPPRSRLAVVVAFMLSVVLSFTAGGIGLARDAAMRANTTLRDDLVVKIERQGGKLVATAKPVKLPLVNRLISLWPGT
jgi:hypothetical protein